MNRSVISLIGGLILAVLAVVVFKKQMDAERAATPAPRMVVQQPQIALARVVVASRDLAYGESLSREDFALVEWPQASVPADGFSSLDDVFAGDIAPRLMREIARGEPLLRARVSGFGETSRLSHQVRADMRAATIRVNDVSGVAGFLAPGDRVDILLTRQIGEHASDLATDLLLQNIVILGIDQRTRSGGDQPNVARTVTVEAAPEQTQKLALAQQIGTLSLSLRNGVSGDEVAAMRVSAADLGVNMPEADRQSGPTVRVRRGLGAPATQTVR